MSTKLKLQMAGSLVVLILAALVVRQNWELLAQGFPLKFFRWETGLVPNAAYLFSFFLLGALSTFVLALRDKFRSRRVIQSLQEELASLKGQGGQDATASVEEAAARPAGDAVPEA